MLFPIAFFYFQNNFIYLRNSRARSGCLRARVSPPRTCRGEGDVMFSLCLANPVVSTPNSGVYGV